MSSLTLSHAPLFDLTPIQLKKLKDAWEGHGMLLINTGGDTCDIIHFYLARDGQLRNIKTSLPIFPIIILQDDGVIKVDYVLKEKADFSNLPFSAKAARMMFAPLYTEAEVFGMIEKWAVFSSFLSLEKKRLAPEILEKLRAYDYTIWTKPDHDYFVIAWGDPPEGINLFEEDFDGALRVPVSALSEGASETNTND